MARLFDVTTTTDVLTLGADGRGKIVFTVTNTTQRPQRASFKVRALDSGEAGWLKLGGDAERDFTAGFTHQVELALNVPSGTPAGKFRVRLDALSVANPNDDFTEGPTVGVTVPAAQTPDGGTKIPWWVWVVIGVVVLLIAGVVIYFVMKPPPPPPPKPPIPIDNPPIKPTVTREFNDPRIATPQGNLALDVCREWGTNCGKPAADAYCVSQGLAGAVDFRIVLDSPPTVIISTKAICKDPGCDRISWVNCSTQVAPARLSAQTLQHLQLLQARGKNVPQ